MRLENVKTILQLNGATDEKMEIKDNSLKINEKEFKADQIFLNESSFAVFDKSNLEETLDKLSAGFNVSILSVGTIKTFPRISLVHFVLDYLMELDIDLQYW